MFIFARATKSGLGERRRRDVLLQKHPAHCFPSSTMLTQVSLSLSPSPARVYINEHHTVALIISNGAALISAAEIIMSFACFPSYYIINYNSCALGILNYPRSRRSAQQICICFLVCRSSPNKLQALEGASCAKQ